MTPNKHHAIRYWSEMCQIWFASKGEGRYGEQLWLRQKAGEIQWLQFHEKFTLMEKPRCTIEVDFSFYDVEKGRGDVVKKGMVYQDFKGQGETRDYRTKRLWLYQLKGIEVEIVKG